MRKLSENGSAPVAQSISNKNLSKAVKVCGYILFLLGIATLFSVTQSSRIYGIIPSRAIVVAAAELASGFMQIKCAGQIQFQKISLIVNLCAAAVLIIVLFLFPDMMKLPAFIGLGALAAAVIILSVRIIKLKNKSR